MSAMALKERKPFHLISKFGDGMYRVVINPHEQVRNPGLAHYFTVKAIKAYDEQNVSV
jgi:hypothetical protein